jgi:hypothetical protein
MILGFVLLFIFYHVGLYISSEIHNKRQYLKRIQTMKNLQDVDGSAKYQLVKSIKRDEDVKRASRAATFPHPMRWFQLFQTHFLYTLRDSLKQFLDEHPESVPSSLTKFTEKYQIFCNENGLVDDSVLEKEDILRSRGIVIEKKNDYSTSIFRRIKWKQV